MNNIFDEGNLRFDFTGCGIAERFDTGDKKAYGMKSVDFIAETVDCLYFIEVKNYQNPDATPERRKNDYEMLVAAGTEEKSVFAIEIGGKIKDSLLRKFADGYAFTKKVLYLLLINLDKLGEYERGLLKAKICGHVPTGLNDSRFSAFTNISFELADAKKLTRYGIVCVDKTIGNN